MYINKFVVGNVYPSNQCGNYIVLQQLPNQRFEIQFIKTGYTNNYHQSTLRYGNVRDPYYPTIYGRACTGNIKATEHAREYKTWHAMLARCYDPLSKCYASYGGAGVYVCDRWLIFENYLNDLPNILGYDEKAYKEHKIVLDKDMKYIGNGNKCYSPETCVFIKQSDNFQEMLTRRKRKTSSRYVGVTKLHDGKWQVTLSFHSKNIYVGRYSTEKEARQAYLKKKQEIYGDE